jgi:acetyl esterase/lipase
MKLAIAATAAVLLSAAPVAAQMSKQPQAVQDKMAELGPIWGTDILKHVQIDLDVFTPLVAAAPRTGVTITRDQSYGPDPRHQLDVFQPDGKTGAPVVVFIHGGAYVRGNKDLNAEIYGNIPLWFARQGMLGINATYRLAPQGTTAGTWPSGAQDVGAIVTWVKENAARFGGDPNRIYLIGHSAGATHVATYAFLKELQPKEGSGLAGVILMSGRYRVDYDPKDPNGRNMQAYFGDDPARYPARSVVNHINETKLPVFVVVAEYDNPGLDVSGAELLAGLCARDGACPRFTRMERHNHLSMVMHFNTADEQIGREMVEFIQRGR